MAPEQAVTKVLDVDDSVTACGLGPAGEWAQRDRCELSTSACRPEALLSPKRLRCDLQRATATNVEADLTSPDLSMGGPAS